MFIALIYQCSQSCSHFANWLVAEPEKCHPTNHSRYFYQSLEISDLRNEQLWIGILSSLYLCCDHYASLSHNLFVFFFTIHQFYKCRWKFYHVTGKLFFRSKICISFLSYIYKFATMCFQKYICYLNCTYASIFTGMFFSFSIKWAVGFASDNFFLFFLFFLHIFKYCCLYLQVKFF